MYLKSIVCLIALALLVQGCSHTIATPQIPKHDIADLLAHPPAAGQSLELDAYYSGAGMPLINLSFPPGGGPAAECATLAGIALTDRPFPAFMFRLGGTLNNPYPADATALPVTQQLDLPYHARFRGHFQQCSDQGSLFVIDQVVVVYEQHPPASISPRTPPAGYASWPRHHDRSGGYSLPYPPGWSVEPQPDSGSLTSLMLRSPQWPDLPVHVQVLEGEVHYDPYDAVAIQSYLDGAQGWPMEQHAIFEAPISTQQNLAGYAASKIAPGHFTQIALFGANGRTYRLELRHPTGYDLPQQLLIEYAAIVAGLQLDSPQGPTPTAPVRQTIGAGMLLSRDQALAQVRKQYGDTLTLLEAQLVSEAEARGQEHCSTSQGHVDGVWLLSVHGDFQAGIGTMRVGLDAASGREWCEAVLTIEVTATPTARPYPIPSLSTPVPTVAYPAPNQSAPGSGVP